nr:uncharacterized protein LOC104119535 isoform X2 [Nicotiana tomentosiformis]
MPSQRWHFYCNVLEKSNTDPLVYLQIHSDFLTRFVLSYAIPKMAFLLQFSFKGHHFVVLPLQSAVLLPVVLQLLVDLPYLGVGLLLVQLLSYRCKRQTSKCYWPTSFLLVRTADAAAYHRGSGRFVQVWPTGYRSGFSYIEASPR